MKPQNNNDIIDVVLGVLFILLGIIIFSLTMYLIF